MQQSKVSVFKKQKEQCLSAVDLSRKGSVDEPIRALVQFINEQENYVTTSSCSGRIVVFSYPSGEVKKKDCDWLFISHESCTAENVLSAICGCQGDAFFKFESFVLHVQCATVEDAQNLLACAVASGYRNSGISISRKGKFVTAIRSTHGLEVPLTHSGENLVSQKYIDHLVNLSSVKMGENFSRIERLFENLKTSLVNQNQTTVNKKSRKARKEHFNKKNSKDQTSTLTDVSEISNSDLNEASLEKNRIDTTTDVHFDIVSEIKTNTELATESPSVDSKQTPDDVDDPDICEIMDLFRTQSS